VGVAPSSPLNPVSAAALLEALQELQADDGRSVIEDLLLVAMTAAASAAVTVAAISVVRRAMRRQRARPIRTPPHTKLADEAGLEAHEHEPYGGGHGVEMQDRDPLQEAVALHQRSLSFLRDWWARSRGCLRDPSLRLTQVPPAEPMIVD